MTVGRHRMIVVDSADPERLATFWHELTGAEFNWRATEWCSLKAPPEGGFRIGFQLVSEPKAGKNRVHVDLVVEDLEPATGAAEALGATRVGDVFVSDDPTMRFQVMLDPEGNEFCLLEGYDREPGT